MEVKWLIPVVMAAVLLLVLYRTGMLTSHAGMRVGGDWGTARWWKGSFRFLSGWLSRSFTVKPGQERLALQVEAEEGALDVEVRDRDGQLLRAWYGAAVLNTEVELQGVERCAVHLRTDRFRGRFFVGLEG